MNVARLPITDFLDRGKGLTPHVIPAMIHPCVLEMVKMLHSLLDVVDVGSIHFFPSHDFSQLELFQTIELQHSISRAALASGLCTESKPDTKSRLIRHSVHEHAR